MLNLHKNACDKLPYSCQSRSLSIQAWRNVSRDTGTLLSPRFKTTGTLSFSLRKHYPKSQKSPGLVLVVPPRSAGPDYHRLNYNSCQYSHPLFFSANSFSSALLVDCMWKKVEGGGRRKKDDYFQILETDLVFRVISLL